MQSVGPIVVGNGVEVAVVRGAEIGAAASVGRCGVEAAIGSFCWVAIVFGLIVVEGKRFASDLPNVKVVVHFVGACFVTAMEFA